MRYYLINLRAPYNEVDNMYYVDNVYLKVLDEELDSLDKSFESNVKEFVDDIFPIYEHQYRYKDEYPKTTERAREELYEDCLLESDYEEITTDEYKEAMKLNGNFDYFRK